MLWVGSLFIPFDRQLKYPFNLKTHVLQLWEIFFHNFLPSVFTVLAIRNSYESDAESSLSLIILSQFQYFCTFILLLNYFFVCLTFQDFTFIFQLYSSILFQQLYFKSSYYPIVLFPQHPVLV